MGQQLTKSNSSSSKNDLNSLTFRSNDDRKKSTKSSESESDSGPNFAWLENRRFMYIDGVQTILPQDLPEKNRELRAHCQLREAQRNVQAPVEEQLEVGIKVLDCGCGGGFWLMDVAQAYPNSTFIGIDISPDTPKQISTITNCFFSTENVLEKLSFPDETFGYAYQRFMQLYFVENQWLFVLKELNRVMKPGAYLELVEKDCYAQRPGPEGAIFTQKLMMAFQARGVDAEVIRHLRSYLKATGFTLISHTYTSIPLQWGGEQGVNHANDMMSALNGIKLWLAPMFGQTREEFEAQLGRIVDEWEHYKSYANYHTFIAQKN